MSVRPSVCPSVRPSLQKSAVTFEPLNGPLRNFQAPLYSLQVNFRGVTRTPRPSGSGPDPKKGGFCQIYLLRGFWGRGSCCTFSELGQRGKQNVGSGILIFGPRPVKTGPEGGAGRGADKNFGISTFFIEGTPAKISRR